MQACNKPNHLAKVCRSNLARKTPKNINEITENDHRRVEEEISLVTLINATE